MARLDNQRWEAMARHLAKGRSIAESYRLAGFEDNSGNASRLLTANECIQKRADELKAAAARRAEVSQAYVLTRLKKLANSSDQKVAVKSLELIAKHLGLFEFTKRVEHSGSVTTQTDLKQWPSDKLEQLRTLLTEQTSKRAD